jgi:triosephosphate isomerase (TIM)
VSRTPMMAGNWKMNKTVAEAEAFIAALLPQVAECTGVDVAICPPFTALAAMVESARGSNVAVYAQTMHETDSGAFTGEVSAPMLAELDVDGVVLGHSERRQHFCETDRALALKVPHALESGLAPILCVGETEEERERGETERKLRHQVQEGLDKVPVERLTEVVLAYEPVWAIGTGEVAGPEDAQEMCAAIRAELATLFGADVAGKTRLLYGGSVKANNAASILKERDVDGLLVGGASLDPAEFANIVRFESHLVTD